MNRKINVVVLGSGGREHALVSACARSPRCGRLYAVPGNPGIACKAECHVLDITDGKALSAFCLEHQIDLAIVGPEGPLAVGVADVLRSFGIAVFGPSGIGAQLEASKEFSKKFMATHQIPTADFYICRSLDEVEKALSHFPSPYIIKASGLAAGKGVFVKTTLKEAHEAARQMLIDKKLGSAGETLIIEKFLPGRELSLMVVTDGQTYHLLSTSQDHKRLLNGDLGPNTGGMGAYAPVPWVTEELMARVRREIIEPSISALREEKLDYRGVLYIGLMITPDSIAKVLEYNVRLGDPEAEVVLPLFEGDWVDLCWHVANSDLASFPWRKENKTALCVILASAGYPVTKSDPAEIHGLDAASNVRGVTVFQAGTSVQDGKIMAVGGRVLCVTATDSTLQQAYKHAYEAVGKIHFQGMQFRNDIGHQLLGKKSV